MIARVAKAMNEKEKGFTLIELLVVIVIIGILSAIAIPAFMGQREKAVDSGIKSDLRTIATEVETYYVDKQEYPTSVAESTGSIVLYTGKTIELSDGETKVKYDVEADGKSFKITGANEKGTDGPGFVYESANGGLKAAAVTP